MTESKDRLLPEKELEFIKRIHGVLIDYLDQKENSLVNPSMAHDDPKSGVNFSLDEPNDHDSIESLINQYLGSAIDTSSPHFYNQLFSGFSTMGYLGEIIASITNSSMYTFEMSPMATLIEVELIKKMTTIVGYENGFGTFVTGGSNANLVAMLAARDRIYPKSKKEGLYNEKILCAFVSEESHYSYIKAGYQLGIGIDQIIRVSSDQTGHMDTDALSLEIKNAIHAGRIPFFVGATAGTTIRGAFDPIKKINEICKNNHLWFHIDGSWGGSVLLSKQHSELLNGSEESDSFAWCAHKMMGVPLMCTVILMKDKDVLRNINNVPSTDYLFHGEKMDLGLHSLQCGRRTDSIKLWLTWKYYGDIGFEKRIDRLFDLAKYAESKVRSSKLFKMVSPCESLNVCFQIQPKELNQSEWSTFTKNVRNRLVEEGEIMVNYANIGDISCIRLIIVNFNLRSHHLDTFFEGIETVSKEILRDLFN